jgi:hypothetical protein
MPNIITLEGFLSVISTTKPITINLFNENDLLLISFELAGYQALDDFLADDEITKIEFKTLNTINVTIDTSKNE